MKALFIKIGGLSLLAIFILLILLKQDGSSNNTDSNIDLNVIQGNLFIDEPSALTIDFTPLDKIKNVTVKVTLDSAFGEVPSLSDSDIVVTSIDLDTKKAFEFTQNSFLIDLSFKEETDSQITIRIGGDHLLSNPIQPGNYTLKLDLYKDKYQSKLLESGNSYLFYEKHTK